MVQFIANLIVSSLNCFFVFNVLLGFGANLLQKNDGRSKWRGNGRTRMDEGLSFEEREEGRRRETKEGEGGSKETLHSFVEKGNSRQKKSEGNVELSLVRFVSVRTSFHYALVKEHLPYSLSVFLAK